MHARNEWDVTSQMPLSFSPKFLVLMEYSGCILEEGERERTPQENSRMLSHLSLGVTRGERWGALSLLMAYFGLFWETEPLYLWLYLVEPPPLTPKGTMAETVQHFIKEKCLIKTQMWIKTKPHQILCFIMWP